MCKKRRFRNMLALCLAVVLCVVPFSAVNALPQEPKEDTVALDDAVFSDVSGYQLKAEKAGKRLYLEEKSGCFVVQSDMAEWRSVPEGITEDPIAKGKNKINLQSLLVIRYGDPETNSLDTVNSQTGAVLKNGVAITDIPDGYRVTYDFKNVEIRIPVEITLNAQGVCVSVITAEVEEYGANYLYEIQLLPGFDAADSVEEGSILIPDGSGAQIDFNNGKAALGTYARPVYGTDGNATAVRQVEMTENALLPLLGLCHKDRTTMAVILENDGMATLNAAVAGKVSSYNTAYPSFMLRTTESYVIGKNVGGGNASRTTILYSKAALTETPLTVQYHLWDGAVGLEKMATACRETLQAQGFLTEKQSEDAVPLYLDVYGAVYKEMPVLGIPVMKEVAVTTYEDAYDLLDTLQTDDIDSLIVRYAAWNRDDVRGRVVDSAQSIGALGSQRELRELLSREGSTIYLENDLIQVSRWQWRYSKKNYASQSISHIPTVLSVFDIATTFPDKAKGNYWLLSPWKLEIVGERFLKGFAKWETPNLGLSTVGEQLYSDYSLSNRTREDAKQQWMSLLEKCRAEDKSLLIAGGNAYAAVYAAHMVDVPFSSSRYDLFDRDVPFYQMVFHGYTAYAGTAINHTPEPTKALLQAVQTGSLLHYSFVGEEGNAVLGNVVQDSLYSTKLEDWQDSVQTAYERLKPLYRQIAGKEMSGFVYLTDEVTATTYDDGTVVVVNFSDQPYVYEGQTVEANDYAYRLP